MTLDGKILGGLFEHERLKPANIQISQGNVHNLVQLQQVMNIGMKVYIIRILVSYIILLMYK